MGLKLKSFYDRGYRDPEYQLKGGFGGPDSADTPAPDSYSSWTESYSPEENAARKKMDELAFSLSRQASGEDMGEGAKQLGEALQGASAAQTAASRAGVMNPATAARLAQQNISKLSATGAKQMSVASEMDKRAAREQLAGLTSRMRAQDLEEQRLKDAFVLASGNLEAQQAIANQRESLARYMAAQQEEAGVAAQNQQFISAITGGSLSGYGSYLAQSYTAPQQQAQQNNYGGGYANPPDNLRDYRGWV